MAATRSGYASWLLVAFAIWLTVATLAFPRDARLFVAAVFVVQGASQWAIDVIKARYRRLRPQRWLHRQELNASFPSGHASSGFVVYGGLTVWVLLFVPAQPLATALCIVFSAWAALIGWSRMALGAHYFSDVAAGYVFGAACASAAAACFPALQRLLVPGAAI